MCACAGVALAQQGYNYNQPPPAPTNLYEQPARPTRPPRPATPPRPSPPKRPSNNYGPPSGAANNPVPDRVPAPGGVRKHRLHYRKINVFIKLVFSFPILFFLIFIVK